MTFPIDFGFKSAAALGVAFLIACIWRRGSASVRYAIWTCALAAVLVLPLASVVGPAWKIDRGSSGVASKVEQPVISVVVHANRPAPSRPWPMIVWIAGVMAMLLRVGAGHWRVRSLFGKAESVRDRRWLALAEETAASIGFRRSWVLKRSTATDVPLSYGLLRATFLLPGDCDHWPEERRRIVLTHEMIHARRSDALWGLLAQCSLAVNWFNPLAWLAVREFRKEQERSCDDAVLEAGVASTVYAAHLVDLARSVAIWEPALGMAERFDLEGRVHALLDPSRGRKAAGRKLCAAMFLAALAVIVPLAAVHAQTGKASAGGTVYDPSGAIVPGAAISLQNTEGSNEEFARAGLDGRFKLPSIPEGQYVVKVTAPGFAMYRKTMALGAAAPSTMDVHLTIGEVKESVEIVGTRKTPAPNATSQRVRVGGMVQPIKLISKVNPDYPADAQAEGVEGTVLLRAVVSKDGSLLSIKSVSNGVDQRLVNAALAAVPLWRYQPATLNAEPVEVLTTIAMTFRLN